MRVRWTFDAADGQSPEDAAVEAFLTMQRRDTSAVVFDVTDAEDQEITVDLLKYWMNAEAAQRAHRRAREETLYYLAIATEPHLPAVQASGPRHSLEEFNEAYKDARDRLPVGTRFFRIEINPFSVLVYGFGVREGAA